MPGLPGIPAPPLRRTDHAGVTGLQLLRGPQGRPMPPAYCIPTAGQAPDRPVSRCSRFPRPRFPGSPPSGATLNAWSPSRIRSLHSRASVHSKVADTSSPAVDGLNFAAADSLPQPRVDADRCELEPKAQERERQKKRRKQDGQFSKMHSPCPARVQGPIGFFLRPWSPCSHLTGAYIPGSCDHPRPRVVREEVAGHIRGPQGLSHHRREDPSPGLPTAFPQSLAPSPSRDRAPVG